MNKLERDFSIDKIEVVFENCEVGKVESQDVINIVIENTEEIEISNKKYTFVNDLYLCFNKNSDQIDEELFSQLSLFDRLNKYKDICQLEIHGLEKIYKFYIDMEHPMTNQNQMSWTDKNGNMNILVSKNKEFIKNYI